MEECRPNSHRYKEEQKQNAIEKRVDKIVTGKVMTKKKSTAKNFANQIISEDAKNVKSFVFGEVLIPAIKKAISDIVTNGIDIILYGETGRRKNKNSITDRISYNSYYDSPNKPIRNSRSSTISSYSHDDIILETRGQAEDVLNMMNDLIESYGVVRVADLYDLVGKTGSYVDNKYGWMNIQKAKIIRDRDGYVIDMPRAIPID